MTRTITCIAFSLLLLGCSQSDERVVILENQIEIISHISINGMPDVTNMKYPDAGDTLTSNIEFVDVLTTSCKKKITMNAFDATAFKTRGDIDPDYAVKILISNKEDSILPRNGYGTKLIVSIVKVEGKYWELVKQTKPNIN